MKHQVIFFSDGGESHTASAVKMESFIGCHVFTIYMQGYIVIFNIYNSSMDHVGGGCLIFSYWQESGAPERLSNWTMGIQLVWKASSIGLFVMASDILEEKGLTSNCSQSLHSISHVNNIVQGCKRMSNSISLNVALLYFRRDELVHKRNQNCIELYNFENVLYLHFPLWFKLSTCDCGASDMC